MKAELVNFAVDSVDSRKIDSTADKRLMSIITFCSKVASLNRGTLNSGSIAFLKGTCESLPVTLTVDDMRLQSGDSGFVFSSLNSLIRIASGDSSGSLNFITSICRVFGTPFWVLLMSRKYWTSEGRSKFEIMEVIRGISPLARNAPNKRC